MNHPIFDHPLNKLQETYSPLRLITPRAEEAMAASLQRFGQLSPLPCQEGGAGLEVIDGFKRLRAARRLGWPTLRVTVLPTSVRAAKASMLVLNRRAQTISDLEEAMIIRSLHRDEGVSQQEIAVLVGRHPSWVSRRLALIERLHEDVLQHLTLGLISPSVGREVAKLPRGNQPFLLRVIMEYRLGKRDAEIIVGLLRGLTSGEQRRLLASPEPLLGRHPAAPAASRPLFYQRLAALIAIQARVLAGATELPLPTSEGELTLLHEAAELSRRLSEFLAGLARPSSTMEVF